MTEKTFFPFGVSYAPYAKSEDLPVSEWESDFQTMRKLNINTIRGFAAWDRIERKKGEYDFSKLDFLFELAQRYDVSIILNAGGAFSNLCGIYPPHWLVRSGLCQEVVRIDGVPSFGPRRFLCMDDPAYKKISENFIRILIKRYMNHPNLSAWSVWNEPILGWPCRCPHTLALFRDYLRKKYNDDLDDLNRRWGTEFPLAYESWDAVEPGVEAGFGGGYLAALDWKNFTEEKIVRNVRHENAIFKELDPAHPTTINIITHAETDRGYRNNLRELARSVDVAGYSHYLLRDRPFEAAMSLDRLRCATAEPHGKFRILETEAGPYRYYGDYYTGSGEGEHRIRNHWQSVARGANTILLWKYRGRVSDKQTDEYNLVAWDGSVTDRAERSAAFAAGLAKLPDPGRFTLHAKAAIFTPQASRKYVELDDGSLLTLDLHTDSISGAYKFFWDRNLPADFLWEEDLDAGALSNYNLLVIPFGIVIPEASGKAIRAFVERGGILLADFGCGMQSEECRINRTAPGSGLKEVFGSTFNDIESHAGNPSEHFVFADSAIPVSDGFSRLHPVGARVLASYAERGGAAVTIHDYGKGKAILCGVSLFSLYLSKQSEKVQGLLEKVIAEAQLTAPLSCPEAEVEALRLDHDDRKHFLYIVINHRNETRDVTLYSSDVRTDILSDPRTDREIRFENGVSTLTLAPYETLTLSGVFR